MKTVRVGDKVRVGLPAGDCEMATDQEIRRWLSADGGTVIEMAHGIVERWIATVKAPSGREVMLPARFLKREGE